MIFELSFEHRDFGETLGFFLQNTLQKHSDLSYSIFQKEEGLLKLWIKCDDIVRLEQIIAELSSKIPQSIYLDEIDSASFEDENLPEMMQITSIKPTAHFCPQCLQTKEGKCEVCSQEVINPSNKIIASIIKDLKEGKRVGVKSLSGEHHFSLKAIQGRLSQRVYCVNVEKILEICTPTSKELKALASYEKPTVRLKPFGEEAKEEFLLVSLDQDIALFRLFEALKAQDIAFVYGANGVDVSYVLAEKIKESNEIVVYENEHFALLKTEKIPQELEEKFNSMHSPDKAFLSTIICENALEQKNILNFYFSFEGGDKVCLYNAQTQWFNEVMNFALPKDLFTLLEEIRALDENSARLIENFSAKYPTALKENISFESLPQGIYGVWEIVKLVLKLEDNPYHIALKNLDKRGVAIDYVFEKDSVILQKFNLAKCIACGMSFTMAGVENEVIALGYVESFSHLPSKLYLALRNLVEIEGISFCGDLFSSKMIGDFFYFNNRQTLIYRNKKFPLLYKR